MKDKNEIEYIVNLDEREKDCIAIRIKATIVFAYPVCKEVLEYNPKVITKTGKVVKNVKPAKRDGENVLVGEIDGERLIWDENGIYQDNKDSELNLFVPERYFDKRWRDKIKTSNGEWALLFQRQHPTVAIPDRNNSRPWGK